MAGSVGELHRPEHFVICGSDCQSAPNLYERCAAFIATLARRDCASRFRAAPEIRDEARRDRSPCPHGIEKLSRIESPLAGEAHRPFALKIPTGKVEDGSDRSGRFTLLVSLEKLEGRGGNAGCRDTDHYCDANEAADIRRNHGGYYHGGVKERVRHG
jgi:hypothetical protein